MTQPEVPSLECLSDGAIVLMSDCQYRINRTAGRQHSWDFTQLPLEEWVDDVSAVLPDFRVAFKAPGWMKA